METAAQIDGYFDSEDFLLVRPDESTLFVFERTLPAFKEVSHVASCLRMLAGRENPNEPFLISKLNQEDRKAVLAELASVAPSVSQAKDLAVRAIFDLRFEFELNGKRGFASQTNRDSDAENDHRDFLRGTSPLTLDTQESYEEGKSHANPSQSDGMAVVFRDIFQSQKAGIEACLSSL